MVSQPLPRRAAQRGTSLIEVLVTVIILAFGLLGAMGLQFRLQLTELESYQRAQALILLEDMSSRIQSNRGDAASYVTGAAAPVGAGYQCATTATSARQQIDTCEWSELLQGAAETVGTNKIGAVTGGRGCVESLGNNEYLITVAWQGMSPGSAPPAQVACGQNLYNGGANSSCVSDRCRRAVTTIVRIGTLS